MDGAYDGSYGQSADQSMTRKRGIEDADDDAYVACFRVNKASDAILKSGLVRMPAGGTAGPVNSNRNHKSPTLSSAGIVIGAVRRNARTNFCKVQCAERHPGATCKFSSAN